MGTNLNRYCERAGLPVPRLEDILDRDPKLFHLMVVALLERGAPMCIEEIAARLAAAGVVARSGDLELSLKKAWHGREPVYRDPDGGLGLNVGSSELQRIIWTVGLRPARFVEPDPPPEPVQPGDDVPLSEAEVSDAFQGHGLYGFSTLRQAAAVLDARSRPMTLDEVEAFLAGMTQFRSPLGAASVRCWRSGLVALDESGRLVLDRRSPDVGAMRQAVRKLARAKMIRRARDEQFARVGEERRAALADEHRRLAQETAVLSRCILRVVPEPRAPAAVSLLDVGARSICTFVGDEIAAVDGALAGFDVLVGLHIRDTLHALRLDVDRWTLVDLKPPQKTRRLNRRGRTLQITPELLISATTGISRPLGDPAKIGQYLAQGQTRKLIRRLESDVKALHAFYRYGVLHRCVRLRWGFLDETLGVDWALPGEPLLYEILRRPSETGMPVDVVVGSAPGWSDPWSRARRVRVLELGFGHVSLQLDDERWDVDRYEIQAVRVVEEADDT